MQGELTRRGDRSHIVAVLELEADLARAAQALRADEFAHNDRPRAVRQRAVVENVAADGPLAEAPCAGPRRLKPENLNVSHGWICRRCGPCLPEARAALCP